MGDPNFVWVLELGDSPSSAMVSMQDPPGGAWEVQLDAYEGTTEGKGTVRFTVSIVEAGEAQGIGTMITVGTDQSKSFNVKHGFNLLDGYHTADGQFLDRSKLRGRMEITGAQLLGGRAYMWVREFPEGETDDRGFPKRPDRSFMSRSEYESSKRAQAVRGGPPPPRPSAPKIAGLAQPAPAAGPAVRPGLPVTSAPPTQSAPPVGNATPPAATPAAMGALKDLFGPSA